MNISGVRPREEIYTYNSIRTNILRGQQIFEAKKRQSVESIKYDVTKAVSDMGKDIALQQYHYFVGANASSSDVPVFRTGENFAL